MAEPSPILRWVALWHERVGRWARILRRVVVLAAIVVAAHVARTGTVPARSAAFALIGVAFAAVVVFRIRSRRALASPRGVIQRVLVPADPELGARALRAEALASRAVADASVGSRELAELHFARVLARASTDRVTGAATRRGRVLAGIALALGSIAAVLVLFEPMRVVEGLDVLVARRGVAPVPLTWLEGVRVTVQPPAYLRTQEFSLLPWGEADVPVGSVIVVRGVPERSGRRLVLEDGENEVEFVDDGAGGAVARWTLRDSATVRVSARFGDVLIREPQALELRARPDSVPTIELEGAPRTISLRDLERLELRYFVTDDHGLRQIDLVLRSGAREDRRVLARLDGQSRVERGAHALDVRDVFLRRMFLPVIATIEARDTNDAPGAGWGRSAAITIVPPEVGEPEAQRLAALEAVRDLLVDLLDRRLRSELEDKSAAPLDAAARKARAEEEAELRRAALARLRAVVDETFAGVRLSSGFSAFALGQARVLENTSGGTPAMRRRIEDVLLALDAGIRSLGDRDAATVAKRLGDVAEEVAEGAKVALRTEKRTEGLQRVEAALGVLETGSAHLERLGALGADLGSVARGELRRIRRAQAAEALMHVELAARHLAARLRRPNPSFSSAGGGGAVEAGPGRAAQGPASEANRRFDELMQELEQLAAEHGEEIRRVEGTLAEADRAEHAESLEREAAERAARLRERLEDLPEPGAQPGSARAAAALAREHMSAMAQNLERLSLSGAVETGNSARALLEQARSLAKDGSRPSNWLDEESVTRAEKELAEQLAWAEQALERMRQRAAARAEKDLAEAGARENALAERAEDLAGRGARGEARMPEEVEDALERAASIMREAARELAAGRGQAGLELEREAQRLLERSSSGRTLDEGDARPHDGRNARGENGREMATDGDVPRADEAQRAAEFRKRVLEGLAKERRGRLDPAVERYAEGLLE